MQHQGGHSKILILVIVVLVAILYAGIGFTWQATDQPEFCGSCHVMHEATREHQESMHAELSCNECHTPQDLPSKVVFKTRAGMKDIYYNFFRDIDDVIQATEQTREVVNENCQSCHTMTNLNVDSQEVKQYCTDCHFQSRHIKKTPVSERRVADE